MFTNIIDEKKIVGVEHNDNTGYAATQKLTNARVALFLHF